MLLLQNAAFLPLFRAAMNGRGRVGDAADHGARTGRDSGRQRRSGWGRSSPTSAATACKPPSKTLAYLKEGNPEPHDFIDAARR
jgi:hypothetical protein